MRSTKVKQKALSRIRKVDLNVIAFWRQNKFGYSFETIAASANKHERSVRDAYKHELATVELETAITKAVEKLTGKTLADFLKTIKVKK